MWHQGPPEDHGLYCMLTTHPFHSTKTKDRREDHQPPPPHGPTVTKAPLKAFHVSLVANPFLAVMMHNLEQSVATDLRAAAPYCYPACVVGPFVTESRAKDFGHALVHGTRGFDSLHEHMKRLAASPAYRDLTCYSSDVPLHEPLSTFLQRHGAPPDWIEAAQRLEKAMAIVCPNE